MVPFSFAGETFVAGPEGALYWPDHEALLVADLHLEKASWFARLGQMLPPYDSLATLSDLALIAASTGAEQIWCLGDSFHDAAGCERLPAPALELLRALTGTLRWVWIVGNHDPILGQDMACGGEILAQAELGGLVLRHRAESDETRPELSGHFHPRFRIVRRGRLVSRRCFVATDHRLILPAFGSLTGGLDADHPEILRALGGPGEALVVAAERLLRFPLKRDQERPERSFRRIILTDNQQTEPDPIRSKRIRL